MSSNDSQNKSKDGQIRSGRLVGKSLPLMIWILAMPALIQQFMAALVGLFDKILAGALPESIVVASLDGLGVGSYVGWLIGIAMAGIGIGGQALIARAMGSGDSDQSHSALGQALSISFAWGLLFGALIASHPLLDMLTTGGHGVALWAPYDNARLFFPEPWRVIQVSPMSLTPRIQAALLSELYWVSLPTLVLLIVRFCLHRLGQRWRIDEAD